MSQETYLPRNTWVNAVASELIVNLGWSAQESTMDSFLLIDATGTYEMEIDTDGWEVTDSDDNQWDHSWEVEDHEQTPRSARMCASELDEFVLSLQ